ncbi:penicillin acylase family protein [Calditrichota bacterium]
MKSRTKKLILIISLVAILLVTIVSIYFFYVLRSSLPITNGKIKVAAINDPIEIIFDKMGIPQVWAKSESDAWFAVGWLHANDRLFQMELTRRVSQGRLSEMFGDITIDFDRMQRKIGHTRIVKSDIHNLQDKDRIYLQAYADGINTWADSISHLPFEYLLLGLDFEPWKIEDCLAILSFQTWFSDALQNNDELFYYVSEKFGEDKARELFVDYPAWGEKTVPQPTNQLSKNTDKQQIKGIDFFKDLNSIIKSKELSKTFKSSILKSIFAQKKFPMQMAHSSNCWAVLPSLSKNDHVIFASDPHLDLIRLPQFWYYIGVHAQDTNLNVLGITAPGLPVIVMGHNGKAAWAFTAGGVDITDQYVEKINPEDSSQYQTPEGWQYFDTINEIIYSTNSDQPETLKVNISRHGPVMAKNDSLGIVYSLKWAGYDKSVTKAAEAGFSLSRINSFTDFRKNVTSFGALDANWMYADINGNIGYQLGTPIPIRNRYNNNLRFSGWEDNNEWKGYYPLEKTPHVLNPDRGWIATSNNKPDEGNLDYDLNGNFAHDRIMRITELLKSKKSFSAYDFEFFQMDSKSEYLLRWRNEAVEMLQKLHQNELSKRLITWDGSGDVNSREMAIIETWLHLVRKLTFEDELGKLYSKVKFLLLERENLPSDSPWYDNIKTDNKEEIRDDILLSAMENALKIVQNKKWGQLQFLTIAHPLAQVPILSGLLNLERGPFPRGGTAGTLNASFNTFSDDQFRCIVGPSWRFIIDFADIDKATIVLPAGQSGHPLSNHFFDFYSLWAGGERWNVPFTKNNVFSKKVSMLTLIPTK